ncbi:hypothetical protein KUTeg_009717 [Tegillarca granosa]|uniref:Uncharacterized protein n=1 Tax=Tegillarca granosa TaxID=220873 RepID=A0ABQ9F4T1_TEGGR|nr:hypothetical protein KUTeg_009717 [Tegillarca granosa]
MAVFSSTRFGAFYRILIKIFRSIVLLPLTAGVKRPNSDYHDGSVSSKVLICSFLAVGVYRNPDKWINPLMYKFKSKLKVKFLWIFGVGCIACHAMRIPGKVVGWLFSYVIEFPELFQDLIHNRTDISVINISCYKNFSLETVFSEFEMYLGPAFAEYYLLLITFILTMMRSTEYCDEELLNTESPTELKQIQSNDEDFTEETSLLMSRQQEIRPRKTLSYYATIALGILLDLPLLMGAVLMSLPDNIEYLNYVFPFTETFATFSASNFVLIMSAFFDMVFHTFGILAGMLSKKSSAKIVLANNALNLVLSYYQTVFIVQAQHVKKLSPKPIIWPLIIYHCINFNDKKFPDNLTEPDTGIQDTKDVTSTNEVNMTGYSSKIRAFLDAAIVLPFTAGTNSNNGGFDGRTSAKVVMCSACAFLFMFIMKPFMQRSGDHGLHVTFTVVNVFDAIATVSLIIFGIAVKRRPFKWLVPLHTEFKSSLKLKFLWSFGFASIVWKILGIIYFIKCQSTNNAHRNLTLTFDFVFIIYVIVELVFISYFSNYNFNSNIFSHYALTIILTCNTVGWFFSFTLVSNNLFATANSNATFLVDFGDNCVNSNTNTSTGIQQVMHNLYPYFYPAFVQYFLLASSYILVMLISTVNENDERELDKMYRNRPLTYREIISFADDHVPNEDDSLLGKTDTLNRSSSYQLSILITFTVGVAIDLPLIIGGLYLEFVGFSVHVYLEWYKTFFLTLVFVVVIIGFTKLNGFIFSFETTVRGRHFVLLMSAFGVMIFHAFGILAGFSLEGNSARLTAFNCLLNVLLDFYQTVFIIHSQHIEKDKKSQKSVWSIHEICLLLSFANFGLWLINSVWLNRMQKTVTPASIYYGRNIWSTIMQTVGTIAIFFRFNCAISMHALYSYFSKFKTVP